MENSKLMAHGINHRGSGGVSISSRLYLSLVVDVRKSESVQGKGVSEIKYSTLMSFIELLNGSVT